MGVGNPRLRADARRKTASDQRDDQQHGHGDHVGYAVDPQRVNRSCEEEIVGKRRGDAGDQAWGQPPQRRGPEHRGQIDHVDRRRPPARCDPQAQQG